MKYYIDRAESNLGHNTLYDKSYIKSLVDYIVDSVPPLTISLQGEWGSGKTTMMNMVKDDLKNHKEIICIDFNAWQFSQFNMGEQLPLAMLKYFGYQLSDEHDRKANSKNKLLKVVENISKIAVNYFGNKLLNNPNIVDEISSGVFDNSDIVENVNELKSSFEEIVDERIKATNSDKIVVFIDDLDRLEPKRAVELLESVKLFCECDKCIFVLAVDYDVILKGSEEKFGNKGKDFFDKIIQVPFNMPLDSISINNYLEGLLQQVLVDIQDGAIKNDLKAQYTNIIYNVIGKNPRKIKRLFSAFIITDLVAFTNGIYKENDNGSDYIRLLLFYLSSVQNVDKQCYKNLLDLTSDKIRIDGSASDRTNNSFGSYIESIGKDETLIANFSTGVELNRSQVTHILSIYSKILDKVLNSYDNKEILNRIFDISSIISQGPNFSNIFETFKENAYNTWVKKCKELNESLNINNKELKFDFIQGEKEIVYGGNAVKCSIENNRFKSGITVVAYCHYDYLNYNTSYISLKVFSKVVDDYSKDNYESLEQSKKNEVDALQAMLENFNGDKLKVNNHNIYMYDDLWRFDLNDNSKYNLLSVKSNILDFISLILDN